MNKTSSINHILQTIAAFAILLLTSYEHKDSCYDHSHNAKIRVVFDWKSAPDAAPEAMRPYLFLMDGGKPQAYGFTGYRRGYVIIPVSRYRALYVNSDTKSVLLRNIDLFDRFEVYALDDVLNVRSSLAPRTEGVSAGHIVKSPDRLYSARLDDVMIKLSDENQAATLYPELSACRYRVTVTNVSNLEYISFDDISDALSGMSRGLLVGRNELTIDPVTIPFGVSSDGDSILTADFLAFGQTDSTSPAYKLVVYVIMSDGNENYHTFDVTHQVDNATDPRDVHIILDGLPLPGPIINGGGFRLAVDGWQSVDVEVPM